MIRNTLKSLRAFRISPVNSKMSPLRFNVSELTGSIGDIGVFFPIYLSLVALAGLPPEKSLILAGLVYIVSGCYFRIPVPVQPLKAMAAIVVAEGLGYHHLAAGGILMGAILLLFTYSRTIEKLRGFFTPVIIKGIQLGIGFMLFKTGIKLLVAGEYPAYNPVPYSPITFPILLSSFWILVIPQLPLTLGNAVYAMVETSREYFGDKPQVTPEKITLSLGIANLISGFAGGLPVCHGSGGLTAHHRFGARTGGSTIITGVLFIMLAFIFGDKLLPILKSIPGYFFGLMLIYVGIYHAKLFLSLKDNRATAVVIAITGLITNNLALALLAGLMIENFQKIVAAIKSNKRLSTNKTL